MLRIGVVFCLLLTIAFVTCAPLTASKDDHSAPSASKEDKSELLNTLKASVEQKPVEKNALTTPAPLSNVKDESTSKTEKSIDGLHSSETIEPSKIAMYVFETGNIEGIEKALKELVESKKMTAEQAAQLRESVLHQVEQMSTASLAALQQQEQKDEAQSNLQEIAVLAQQLQNQAELKERLYDRITELYGKATILNDEQAGEALQTFITAVGESANNGDLDADVTSDLVDVIDAALRDVKTAAGTVEQKDEAEELRHLANQQ